MFILYYSNSKLKDRFLKENENAADLLYKSQKEAEKLDEEKKEFLKNLESYKNKVMEKDFLDIENWDLYKKKNIFKSNYKNKKNIKPFFIKLQQIIILISNLKKNELNKKITSTYTSIQLTANKDISALEKKFIKIQLNKIKSISKNKYFNINKILYVIIDIRKLKTKIICFNKQKCLFTISNGLVFKKLNLKIKKNKKSEKTTNLLIKTLNTKKNYFQKFNKIIVYIKGVKKYINNILKYLNLNIFKDNAVYLLNKQISKSKKFNFKKIKSIKRRLKKKIIKLK